MKLRKTLAKWFPIFVKDCEGPECSTQEGLQKARRQDQRGNYDIDGASFDGDNLYIGGRMEGSHLDDTKV